MSKACAGAILLALLAGGCGGDSAERPPERPKLPPALADRLAAQADAVARNLDEGDTCAADRRADELHRAAVRAIEDGRVPRAFRRELRSEASTLAGAIECVRQPPPPPPPPAEEEKEEEEKGDDKGKDKGEDKGKGKDGDGEGDDDGLPTEPLETVTEGLRE